ncbi:hypothetical protein M2138_001288 [Dysgonomonadaceae bacterium PH5-43]|nr:hypothetical protein [Dysgonomonadaceae bacterium PH5-43]
MKNKFLFIMVLMIVAFQNLSAQSALPLPEASTAAEPKWYYIQVVGDTGRENRVFAASGSYLIGEAISKTKDAQLFRFEKSGDNYIIINKSTGSKVNVGKNGSDDALVLSDAGLEFKLDYLTSSKLYYQIKATSPVTGGDASKLWAHQANSNSSYKIILVNTAWNTGINSQFSFIPYENYVFEYSTDTNDIYYTIESQGANSGCITDASGANSGKLTVEELQANKDNQLWKVSLNGTKVNFINKATGNVINTESAIDENNMMYNFTQLSTSATSSNAWTLSHVRAGQHTIAGIETDNVTRYLNAALDGTTPDVYDSADLINSNFAWILNKKKVTSSLPEVQEVGEGINIYSINKRIFVEGTDSFEVRNLQGITVNKNTELSTGVYLVTVSGVTKKVMVK